MQDTTPSGIYSNLDIENAIENGHIICTPFVSSRLNKATISVTLGQHYYKINSDSEFLLHNDLDSDELMEYFDGPYKGLSNSKLTNNYLVISIKPNQRILAHTHEFIGIKQPGAFELKEISEWSSYGLSIKSLNGFYNPDYINRPVIEIYNLNKSQTVVIPVGATIAEVVFYHTGEVRSSQSKPRPLNDLENIIQTWSPSLILPAINQQEVSSPIKIDGATYE